MASSLPRTYATTRTAYVTQRNTTITTAGNESCPQPQTSEHLAAVEIMRLNNIIILQNKVGMAAPPIRPATTRLFPQPCIINPPPSPPPTLQKINNQVDLVKPQDASMQHEQIRKFVAGTVADSSPIIPISAVRCSSSSYFGSTDPSRPMLLIHRLSPSPPVLLTHHRNQHQVKKFNIDVVCEYLVNRIPVPPRDFTSSPRLIVIRSFDVNKPGELVDDLKGACVGWWCKRWGRRRTRRMDTHTYPCVHACVNHTYIYLIRTDTPTTPTVTPIPPQAAWRAGPSCRAC